MLGKISFRSSCSYVFASPRFVHPCQIRAIIGSKSKSKPKMSRLRQGNGEARPASQARRKTWSHAHDLVTAIDVDDLPGDGRGGVAGKKDSGGAKLGRIATAL